MYQLVRPVAPPARPSTSRRRMHSHRTPFAHSNSSLPRVGSVEPPASSSGLAPSPATPSCYLCLSHDHPPPPVSLLPNVPRLPGHPTADAVSAYYPPSPAPSRLGPPTIGQYA
ncbi:hypothetical protein NL676_034522 [Syzygium grande]|nr:hypothetical protein NL676_034522 [Syzygium grande]